MAHSQRSRGTGFLFRKKPKGAWIASYWDHAGKRQEHSTRTTDRQAAERILTTLVADAADWLRDYMGDCPKLARDVLTESKAAGFSRRTIDRAKPAAGVRTRQGAFGGGWVWELSAPSQERQTDAEDCHTADGGSLGGADAGDGRGET